ncbi:OmpA family protein [Parvularcula sp. ZS-1/3]|uniref:OmpA family protein n=1 Tax=Parvularcula mediterranea TaxID=2732508 RepID=A0A7Y3W433_9PROT|nr:flagellar motor protein MotB [Parvularcula mediterranea]NNU15365.1 OmpA family protein [Parvularcula mediterranea]
MAETQPIIRRGRSVEHDDHHGGAWKVAYADFVTSMMAFFMLLWILGATTESQRRGIADYFNPSIPISPTSGGGNDLLNGDSVFTTESLATDNRGGVQASDQVLLREIEDVLSGTAVDDAVKLTLAPEGVVVDLMDTDDKAVFDLGNAGVTPRLERILDLIVPVLADSGRRIKVVGHTDDLQFSREDYGNWELSSDRAHAARRLATQKGLSDRAFFEVTGHADRLPLNKDASAPQNRRISFILLNPEGLPLNAR